MLIFSAAMSNFVASEAMTSIINHTELRVIGMSRSGNHPIINWIRRQAPGRVCFLNCAEPRTNPFNSCRPLASGRRAVANFRPFRLRCERQGRFSHKDWLIYSYEDCFLTMVNSREFEKHRDEFVGPSHRRTNVLILRDPFNLFASRMQSSFSGVTPKTAVRIWKQHARQFLGERQLFSQPTIAVSYNQWVTDRQYRRRLSEQLGLNFSDSGFDHVPTTGGGSSFDGVAFHRRATDMPTLDRWRRFRNDPAYRQIFDPEMVRLAEAAFDLAPEIDAFIQKCHRHHCERCEPSLLAEQTSVRSPLNLSGLTQ